MIFGIIMVFSPFFFGPVLSRRLGSSLGIDLLPRGQKNCPFNCLYCEIGSAKPISCQKRFNYYPGSITEFVSHLKIIIEEENPSSLTFVGYMGEPTLNKTIYEYLDATNDLLTKLKNNTSIPTILSNSSTVSDLNIQKKIIRFKRLVMKLDAGEQKNFNYLNQPHPSVPNIKEIIENLAKIRKQLPPTHELIIQTLMTNKNNNKENLEALIEGYEIIQPKSIQLYSISRAPASQLAKRLNNDELEKIKKYFEANLKNSIQINVY
ncbi:MAG: hypothetical protein EAX96_15540 [Candidatus Lokiarchaeota archaeon]|nr:hypothetical protein [Candidatus Lokiarchaeota archaeon]